MTRPFRKISFAPLFFAAFFLFVPSVSFAFVPLVCDLCTLGVIAGLAVSRYLGVDDSVIGVWVGAMIVALVIMTNAYLERKNLRFRFRDSLVAATYLVFSGISLYYSGVIGIYRNTFFHSTSIFADKILVSGIAGGGVLIGATYAYQLIKAKNGGHSHFPFEKVAIPLMSLVSTSIIFYIMTAK